MRRAVALLLCIGVVGCFKLPSSPSSESEAATSPSLAPVPMPKPADPPAIIAPDGIGAIGDVQVRVLNAAWKLITKREGKAIKDDFVFGLVVEIRNTSENKMAASASGGGAIR